MSNDDIINQLQGIFRDVLDDETVSLTATTTAEDVDGWDSLSHIQLIVAAEKHFRIKLDSREILSWSNVGEMAQAIARKLGNA
jgi:acyl carrier protein